MRTASEFQEAARKRNITQWLINKCSLCGVPIGYIISNNDVYFESGCDCSPGSLELRSWDDIADFYNLNAGADDVNERMEKYPKFREYVREVNEFWGFDEQ